MASAAQCGELNQRGRNDYRNYVRVVDRCELRSMKIEPTLKAVIENNEMYSLKQIMIDAARYRWLREENAKCCDENSPAMTFYVGMEDGTEDYGWIGVDLDLYIDQELAKP